MAVNKFAMDCHEHYDECMKSVLLQIDSHIRSVKSNLKIKLISSWLNTKSKMLFTHKINIYIFKMIMHHQLTGAIWLLLAGISSPLMGVTRDKPPLGFKPGPPAWEVDDKTELYLPLI